MRLLAECETCRRRYLLAVGHPSTWLIARIPEQVEHVLEHKCETLEKLAGLVKV